MMKVLAIALAGALLSSPVFAQAGGPDLPGGAKTTSSSGKATMSPKKNRGMKMMKKGSKMHKTM